MQILVCEDMVAIQRSLRIVLDASYTIVGVTKGADAIARASAGGVGALMIDLSLSGVPDAFEVIRRLRAGDATRDLPIMACSQLDGMEIRQRAQNAGATCFAANPVRPLDLLEWVKSLSQ